MSIDPLNFFIDEVCLKILSNFNSKELAICCQVNTRWNVLASDNALWKHPLPHLSLINDDSNYKKKFQNLMVSSYEKVILQIKEFVKSINLNQSGKLDCIFFHDPTFSIEISIGKEDLQDKFIQRKVLVCMQKIEKNDWYCESISKDNATLLHPKDLTYFFTFKSILPPTLTKTAQIVKILSDRVNELIKEQIEQKK